MRGRGLVLLIGAMAIFGCKKKISKDKVEKQIKAGLAQPDKLGKPLEKLSCPSGVKAKKGESFTCDAAIDGIPFQVVVTQTSDQGEADYNIKGLIATAVIAKEMEAKAKTMSMEAKVDCGKPFLAAKAGEHFDCTVTVAGQARKATVTIKDEAGTHDVQMQ